MKKKICQYLSEVLVEMPEDELMKTMEIPPEEKMGDFALPCFVMAKNFHIGHLRTTVIGNSLYKIYQKLGYDVVRINHYFTSW